MSKIEYFYGPYEKDGSMVDNVRSRYITDLKRKEALISVQNNKYKKRDPLPWQEQECLNLQIDNTNVYPTNYQLLKAKNKQV